MNSLRWSAARASALDRTDIVELIGQTVALKRSGKDYVGLCPFHSERTPSFHVSPSKRFFHCFGCKASGNAIDFVMKRDGLEFVAALRSLDGGGGGGGGWGGTWRPAQKPARAAVEPPAPKRNDLHILAQKFKSGCKPARLEELSRKLRLSIEALKLCEAGWTDGEPGITKCARTYAWSFPMRDENDNVIGIRLRTPQKWKGKDKYSVEGGTAGLFLPRIADNLAGGGRAFVLEGASDTPAAIDLGLPASGAVIGRDNANSNQSIALVAALVRKCRFDQLIIFSQLDVPHYRRDGSIYFPAQDGAAELATRDWPACPSCGLPALDGHVTCGNAACRREVRYGPAH